jgi:hypothetical protein
VAVLGNLFFGWHYTSASVVAKLILLSIAMGVIAFVGKGWHIVPLGYDEVVEAGRKAAAPPITAELLKQILLMLMAVLIFCAVAVAASTRLGQVMTLLVCFGVFILGSLQPMFAGMADRMPAFNLLKWTAPNLTYFYGTDAIYSNKPIPMHAIGLFALYGGCYLGAVLSLGIALFQTRQLETQATSSALPGRVGLVAWAGRIAAIVMAFSGLTIVSLLWLEPIQRTALAQMDNPWAKLSNLGLALASAGLLAGAILGWIFWGYFARGARWSYWLLAILSVLGLSYAVGAYVVPGVIPPAGKPQLQAIQLIACAAVLLILIMSKTRYHFQIGRPKGPRKAGHSLISPE